MHFSASNHVHNRLALHDDAAQPVGEPPENALGSTMTDALPFLI